MPLVAFSPASLHYLFTPALTLPLKGEGIIEIVSYPKASLMMSARRSAASGFRLSAAACSVSR